MTTRHVFTLSLICIISLACGCLADSHAACHTDNAECHHKSPSTPHVGNSVKESLMSMMRYVGYYTADQDASDGAAQANIAKAEASKATNETSIAVREAAEAVMAARRATEKGSSAKLVLEDIEASKKGRDSEKTKSAIKSSTEAVMGAKNASEKVVKHHHAVVAAAKRARDAIKKAKEAAAKVPGVKDVASAAKPNSALTVDNKVEIRKSVPLPHDEQATRNEDTSTHLHAASQRFPLGAAAQGSSRAVQLEAAPVSKEKGTSPVEVAKAAIAEVDKAEEALKKAESDVSGAMESAKKGVQEAESYSNKAVEAYKTMMDGTTGTRPMQWGSFVLIIALLVFTTTQ